MKKQLYVLFFALLTFAVSSCKNDNEPEQPQPQEAELVTIDGKFKDWDALAKNKQSYVSMCVSSKVYDKYGINQLAVYVNKTYIYFMIHFDEAKAKPLNLFFATMGEIPTTAINLWNPCYVDYRIEFGKGDTFVEDPADMDWSDWNYQQLMAYDHVKGGWNWTMLGQNMVTLSEKTSYGGIKAVEGRLPRNTFEYLTGYFYIGAYISNNSFVVTGAQPAATIEDEEVIAPPMLQVMLPK